MYTLPFRRLKALVLSTAVLALPAESANTALSLTPAATARGFSLSLFADRFPFSGSTGPLGIGFLPNGGVMVSDHRGFVRVFPTNSDGQHADLVPAAQNYFNPYDFAVVGERVFMVESGLVELKPDGTLLQRVQKGQPLYGLATNPANGHVIAGGTGIWDFDPRTGAFKQIVPGSFDGISLSPDGAVVYAAASDDHIYGYDTTSGKVLFDSGRIVGGVDGTAVGTGVLAGKLYVNMNDGTVVELDLGTKTATVIASGGSRGDFAKVSPDGTVLLTQTETIFRLRPPPGGGFGEQPPVIDNFTARFKDSSVDLAWIPPAGIASTAYAIYRRTETAPAARIITGLTATNFTDSALTNNTTYYYTVRWLDPKGVESSDSTEMSTTPTSQSDRAAGKTPPTILTSPPTQATAGQTYAYSVRAADPDPGDGLIWTLPTAPSGMTIDPATGVIQWTPGGANVGSNPVRVRVEDKQGHFAAQAFILRVQSLTSLSDPAISSKPVLTGIAGLPYLYQVTATDPNNGAVLRYSLPTAPAGMTVDPVSGLIRWTPGSNTTQTVLARVQDQFGRFAQQSFLVKVGGPEAPVISSTPVTVAAVGHPYQYAVIAKDPNGLPLTYSLLGAPTGMFIDPVTGLIQWTPVNGQLGFRDVTVRVENTSRLGAAQTFTVNVSLTQNRPPVITSTAPATATVGQQYSYAVVASDPDNDPLTYLIFAGPAGMTIDIATGAILWTPSPDQLGDWPITIGVKDTSGLQATQKFTARVARAYPLPVITINSPAPGTVINKPMNVVASLSDPGAGSVLLNWTVDLQRGDGKEVRRIGAGSGSVSGGVIARIDPTLIRDDAWSLVITTNKAGQADTFPFRYEVTSGNYKLGNFKMTFTDLVIPVAGIPVVITREYDSLDTSQGEFGAGWRLALPGRVVDSARETPLEPFLPNTRVYVTRPDGRRVGFTFDPIPPTLFQIFWRPRFRPDPGVTDTLEAYDAALVNSSAGFSEALGGPYNPAQYLLTTKQGLKYLIDEVAGLQRITDRNGNTLDVTPTGLRSTSGLSLPFERDEQGRIVRIKEPSDGSSSAAELQYRYDATGNLIGSVDQLGNETKYLYEDARFPHYLTRIEDPLSRPVTRNVYNAQGKLTGRCDASGNVLTLAGCVQFDSKVELRVQTVINPRGFKTELLMDDRGNIVTERRYLDDVHYHDLSRTFDEQNNLLTRTDMAGNTWRYTFDPRGNQLTETDPGGHTLTYTYNACDLIATAKDASGNMSTFAYDAHCNLRLARDPVGNTTEFQYNSAGQRTKMIDPLGTAWTWAYDSRGFTTTRTDPFGKSNSYSFSSSGDLLRRIDRMGRRADYAYDRAHRLISETWPDGRSFTYRYNAAGQPTSASDANSVLAIAYDDRGQIASVDNQGTPGVPRIALRYAYNPNGNRSTLEDSTGGVTMYDYNALDQLVTVRQFGTGVTSKRVNLAYDESGLITEIRRYSDSAGYNAVANTTYTYDCGGCAARISNIQNVNLAGTAALEHIKLTRDPAGNVQRRADSDGQHDYSYDASARLLGAQHSSSTMTNEFYRYDAAGNRIASHRSNAYSYSYQTEGAGNRLIRDDRYEYVWDAEGNLARKLDQQSGATTLYTYDIRNRLTQIIVKTSTDSVAMETSIAYDALDRRIALRSSRDGETYSVYDGLDPVLQFVGSTKTQVRWLFGPGVDTPLASDTGGVTEWLFRDQVGTVRSTLSSSGEIKTIQKFDSFGIPASATGSDSGFQFTSRPGVMGLVDFRLRFYDPEQGRFTQEDPLEPRGYEYVRNNPLRLIDPLGCAALTEKEEIDKEWIAEEAEGGGPCEQHHVYPKYMLGYDNGVLFSVPVWYHRLVHAVLFVFVPWGWGPVGYNQTFEIINMVYRWFPLIPCI